MIPSAGILTPIERPLEELLFFLHQSGGLSWAWSIIALVGIVRLIIFPITAKQTRSSLAMQRLSPYVKQLQQKHKDDRQQLNVEMMEFYRLNKVNPLSSCLPLLIQLPIFFALFNVLKDFKPPPNTSSDFSFLFGIIDNILVDINDGGVPAYTLLVFYVASQVLSSYTMMTSPDPKQRIIFMLLPVFIAPFILGFPIGLLLYWTTTNLWSLGQYLLVVKFSDAPQEVVLPTDSKGRNKVIIPRDVKRGAQHDAKVQAAAGSGAGKSGSTPAAPRARRNKRRR